MPSDLAARLRKVAPETAALEQTTAAPGLVTKHAPSHGDLNSKNALIVRDGVMALDWDAAGVHPVARERRCPSLWLVYRRRRVSPGA